MIPLGRGDKFSPVWRQYWVQSDRRSSLWSAGAVLDAAVIHPLSSLMPCGFSHRFAGPLVRFRKKALKAIAAGEEIELLKLRNGDYLGEMHDEFNAMLEALEPRSGLRSQDARGKALPNQPVAV